MNTTIPYDIINSLPEALYIIDLANNSLELVNESMTHMLGYSYDELYNMGADMPLLLSNPNDKRLSAAQSLAILNDHHTPDSIEHTCRLKHKDGSWRWCNVREIIYTRNENESPAKLLGIINDITIARLTEDELFSREAIILALAYAAEKFLGPDPYPESIPSILEQLGEAALVSRVYIFENYADQNSGLSTSLVYEWAAEQVKPFLSVPELQNISYDSPLFDGIKAIVNEGNAVYGLTEYFNGEFQALLKAKSTRSILLVPIFVGNEWWGLMGFDECKSEREWSAGEIDSLKAAAATLGAAIRHDRARAALKQSEERYRNLIENTSDLVWEADTRGRYTYISPKVQDVLGYSPGEFIGQPMFTYTEPAEARRMKAIYTQLASEKNPFSRIEITYINHSGLPVILETNGVPFFDDDNSLLGFRGIHRDITDRKRIEKELENERLNLEHTVADRTRELHESLNQIKDTNLRLEEANRHKSRFLSSISHELRTPLNAIIGFADLFKSQHFGPLNEKQLHYVNQINESSAHLLALINDLLDMAKIDAGAMSIVLDEFSVDDLITAITSMMAPQFRKKNFTLAIETAPDLPCLNADLRKCKQILLNLLSNAVKFTPENGRITISAELFNNTVFKLSVRDTGIGIKPEECEKIFSEFHQADRVRDEHLGGTGIGLALTRRLVELHGGRIGVESQVGSGSCFWFTLPLKKVAQPLHGSVSHQPAFSSASLKGRKILIVDDNEVNCAMLIDILGGKELIVATAKSGFEALDVAVSFKPDLILMDYKLPVMDGLEATRRLRCIDEFKSLPIIALTSGIGDNADELCRQAGCSSHLTKPVQAEDIYQVLYRFLSANSSLP